MKDQEKPTAKFNPKPTVIEWDSRKKTDVKAQNNMSDPTNEYNHINLPNNIGDGLVNEYSSKIKIVNRGKDNLAPQMDLELGKRSITHNKIAVGLSDLVCGDRLEFKIKNPANEDGTLSAEQEQQLTKAKALLDLGLQESRKVVGNGMTYFRMGSIVAAQKKAAKNESGAIVPTALRFNAKPNEQLRISQPKMNSEGTFITEYHLYHPNWGFTGNNCDNAPQIPVISLTEYIRKSNNGKLPMPTVQNPHDFSPAYYVKTSKSFKSGAEDFISFSFTDGEGIFDNAYPLPTWKTSSSLNDIQAEFEASCIRIDHLRNGLHIFAVANIYSTSFNATIANDSDGKAEKAWENGNKVIENIKKSHHSGRILINPVHTTDESKDGKVEIQELTLTFPVEATKFFNEESRASILTAWGVMADLFSISKPEKNNLRSQAEFLNMGIVLLQNKIRSIQMEMERGYNEILEYYGFSDVVSRIIPKENNVFLIVMKEFAAQYMTMNEVRSDLLGLNKLNDDERNFIINEKMAILGKLMQQQGVTINPQVSGAA